MERLKQFLSSRRAWCVAGSVLAMALIAIIYFYPDDMQGNVLRQHDMQQGIAIGQETKVFAETTGVDSRWTGSLFSGMPTFQISPYYPSNSMFSWLHTVMGLGLPSPANLLFAMMIGFFILLMTMRMRWYVALIGAIAYGFSSYFIIIIGAGHLMKFITLAYVPPTIAGVILAYRGRYIAGAALTAIFAMLQISANHPQMTYYFLFVIFGIAIAYLVSAIPQRQIRRWLVASGALAVAALLAVGANLPSLYNTYEYSKQTMRGGHSELTTAVIDPDNSTAGGLDRDYITQYSYTPSETFSLLIPNIKGGASNKPEKGDNLPVSLSQLKVAQELIAKGQISAQEATYLDYMSQYFGDPEGTNGPVYVGALIVALFLLGCAIVRGPLKWALVILTLFSILLALGRHFMGLTDFMIDNVPMYNKFRTVESILVIAEFTMPLLAAMALQKIFEADPAEAWHRYRRPLYWSFGIVLAICLLGVVSPGVFGDVVVERDRQIAGFITAQLQAGGADAQTLQYFSLDNPRIYSTIETLRHQLIEADALRSFLIVAIGLCVLVLYFRRKLSLGLAVVICGIIVCGDLFLVNKRYLDTESFLPRQLSMGDPFPMTDADRTILADTTTHYRVMNIPQFWQADPSYRHKTIGGYHAAKLTRYQDMIDRHLSRFLDNTATDADWNVLNMLNARWIVDMTGQAIQNPEAYGNAWFIDSISYVDGADAEMAALDEITGRGHAVADRQFADILGQAVATAEADTIRLTSYAPNRLTYHVSSERGGIVALSEVYFPWGWEATIDGTVTPIGRINYLLRALRVPAGSHTLVLTFDPASLRNTVLTARISIIVIYALCLAALAGAYFCHCRCRRKDENESSQK